ncbi:MAG TPA: TIM barrel protein [Tepidisphaeraceae bacterium]|jgi:hypothetical protein
MRLELVRPMWGIDPPIDQAIARVAAAGYSHVECAPPEGDDAKRFFDFLAANKLGYIGMLFTGGKSPAQHARSFMKQAELAAKCGAKVVTAHTGSDTWDRATANVFFAEVLAMEDDLPVRVAHETHRGRILYNPWITRDLLTEHPKLKLCSDFSHWVCVAERLEWDDASESIIRLCAERSIHCHARVGYEQGPQVPDPSAPEYARHVQQHFDWWKQLYAAAKARGDTAFTIAPEYGPPGYLHTLPHTNVPVANLWNVCEWTSAKLREQFGQA